MKNTNKIADSSFPYLWLWISVSYYKTKQTGGKTENILGANLI